MTSDGRSKECICICEIVLRSMDTWFESQLCYSQTERMSLKINTQKYLKDRWAIAVNRGKDEVVINSSWSWAQVNSDGKRGKVEGISNTNNGIGPQGAEGGKTYQAWFSFEKGQVHYVGRVSSGRARCFNKVNKAKFKRETHN